MKDMSWLWHARMGHLNFQALEMMFDKDMAIGLPRIEHPNQLCSGCMVAKRPRAPFPSKTIYRADSPLQLLNADLCGAITPCTHGGNQYFLLVVDDFTRMMWISLLKNKAKAFQAFKNLKVAPKSSTNNKIKALRIDRRVSSHLMSFNSFCKTEGIERFLIAPYTPQQNRVVERRNRIVVAMVRSLLISKVLPGEFWGEAARHAVYLLNRATKAPESVSL